VIAASESAHLLTIAIPTFNGKAHLAEALQSILSQEPTAFDLLICDDQSDDGSPDLVRALAGDRARIVVNEQRLGLAGNWNQCMAMSRTPWVNLFHQDDVMTPGQIAGILQAIAAIHGNEVSAGLIASPVAIIDDQSRPVPTSVIDPGGLPDEPTEGNRFFAPGEFVDLLAASNPLRCSAVTTSKVAHEAAGGFDPKLRYVVDWEFWYRVTRAWGLLWRETPGSVLVRWHAGSETHRFKAGLVDLEETQTLLDQISRDLELDSPSIEQGRRTLSRAFLNRAHDALRAGQGPLARESLDRAWSLSRPAVLAALRGDPRLLVQMTALRVLPSVAARVFARRG
jgi:glycosyltransferase involved in cell wall biosynthesis